MIIYSAIIVFLVALRPVWACGESSWEGVVYRVLQGRDELNTYSYLDKGELELPPADFLVHTVTGSAVPIIIEHLGVITI